jgi:hypothetical protein
MKNEDRFKTYGGGAGMFVRKIRTVRSADAAATKTSAVAPSSTALLLGWDDVKCRPIFEKTLKPVTISDEEDDDLSNKEIVKSEWDAKPGRKKRKAYGSRKGESAVIETATFTQLSRRNIQNTVVKEWSAPIPSTNSCFPYDSPLFADTSICDVLDSDRKQFTTTSSEENLVRAKSLVVETRSCRWCDTEEATTIK